MTVGTFEITNPGLLARQDGSILPDVDTMVAVLVDDAHTVNLVTDTTYADISANECADADYTASFAEGLVLTMTVDETGVDSGIIEDDMSQADFGAAVTIAARYFYILKRVTGSLQASDEILGVMDLNDGGSGNVSSVNSDFKVDAHANGLYRFTKA
jgi:hypothetical protein